MEAKTKKILFYVGAGLVIAAAVVFGIVEIAGGPDEVAAVDSVAVEVVDTLQVADTLVVDTLQVAE